MQDRLIRPNIIIKEPSKNLRALGRNALRNRWKQTVIAFCIYLLIAQVPPIIFNSLFGTNVGGVFTNSGYTYGMDANVYAQLYNAMPEYCFLSAIYVILIEGAFSLGLAIYFLAVFRGHETEISDIFLGFEKFGKALGLYLFIMLFTVLWTLLFIIPGIIASIRYSQAFFILADDPTKGIRQCVNESKSMMKGNKSKFFWLNLSFFGWLLLAAIPASLFAQIGAVISNNVFVITLLSTIGELFLAPVQVYMYATLAGFYEILAGHLIKETEPIPVMPIASPQPEEAPDERFETSEEMNENAGAPTKATEEIEATQAAEPSEEVEEKNNEQGM